MVMQQEGTKAVHEGRNVKRIREMLGIKQDSLAMDLGISQQAISALEQKEALDRDMLEKIANALKVPVEAIQNFDEEKAVNVISSTFYDNAAVFNNYPTFNPIDKIVELYERMLALEREKNELLERLLAGKK
jgi:transcriptional regulator with XRE-family HTH domain